MKRNLLLASILAVTLFGLSSPAQNQKNPLDDYIDSAGTIVIAKCLSSGPVNILLKARVELDVLLVLKGDASLKRLSVEIGGGLIPGEMFLIRLPDHKKAKEKSNFGNEGANVIPVSGHEKIEELKQLSPRIVILRTINLRIDQLEGSIRRETYELDAIKAVKGGN